MHMNRPVGIRDIFVNISSALDANIASMHGLHCGPLDFPIVWSTCKNIRSKKLTVRLESVRKLLHDFLNGPATAKEKDGLPLIYPGAWQNDSRARGSHPLNVSAVLVEHDAKTLQMDRAASLLREAGVSGIFYETPSALDGERWRCVCPLAKPISVSDRLLFVHRLNAVLGGALAPESADHWRWWYVGALAGTHPRRIIEVE